MFASLGLASFYPRRRAEGSIGSERKFLLISDVHVGKADISARQANAQAAVMLRFVFKNLPNRSFDHLYDLGDITADLASEEESIENLRTYLGVLQTLNIPATPLHGNHDVWNIRSANLSKTYREMGFDDRFYGVDEYSSVQIVRLDLIADRGVNGQLPEARLEWLRQVIHPDTPTIILSHEGLVEQDVATNFYFKGNPAASMLANGPQVWKAISDLPIIAIISGHLHQPAYRLKGSKTHMITVPSFTERIPPNQHSPAVYSVLYVNGSSLTLRSFSGARCIFKVEV
jgi:UDP-2,3-diacylglucosamine pyrophosphatase LpxH